MMYAVVDYSAIGDDVTVRVYPDAATAYQAFVRLTLEEMREYAEQMYGYKDLDAITPQEADDIIIGGWWGDYRKLKRLLNAADLDWGTDRVWWGIQTLVNAFYQDYETDNDTAIKRWVVDVKEENHGEPGLPS